MSKPKASSSGKPVPKPKPKKKPAAKAPSYADSTYNKQMAYFKKLMADFAADQTRKSGEVASYYGTQATPSKTVHGAKTVMKRVYVPAGPKNKTGQQAMRSSWKKTRVKTTRTVKGSGKPATEGVYQKELRRTAKQDLSNIGEDYASRGILRSGMYAKKNADYNTEFGNQMNELTRKKTSAYGDISSERTTFQREQELQKEQARLEAVRRRAAASGSFLS